MISQVRRQKWVALTMLLALALVALWFLPSSLSPVRVTFRHATNDPVSGKVGVIELVNNLKETVVVMGGWYVPAKRKDLSISKETPLAYIDGEPFRFTAQSTNTAQVHIPTNGGAYRLVFQCVPDSKDPPRMQGTLRYRILNSVYPWLHPSQKTIVRWSGGFFVVSQSIDVQ